MPYTPYLNDGGKEDFYPEVGKKYFVIVRRQNFEEAFVSVLNLIVKRDYLSEPEDRTPSYRFDNGVSLHGEGISFYKELPLGIRDLGALYHNEKSLNDDACRATLRKTETPGVIMTTSEK